MRSFHHNLRASCVLLLWCLAAAFVLSLEATVVFAVPVCGCPCGCSCSNYLCCNQCQQVAIPAGNGTFELVGVKPPCADSQYVGPNYDNSNFSVTCQSVTCYSVPANGQWQAYDSRCIAPYKMVNGPLQLSATGCTSSGACGG